MRIPIIAGNWKMYTTAAEARALCVDIRDRANDIDAVEKVVCPPFLHLPVVKEALTGSNILIGAQNVHWEEQGAFTGEISAAMLLPFCTYAIIGHSERRALFGETDETVNRRVRRALASGLRPIMCVGETLEERDGDRMEDVLARQVREGLREIEVPESFVIAYEPVWAIGTGRAATAQQADEAIGFLRGQVAKLAGVERAERVRIQYGGSVNAANAAELLAMPQIDGALVGGASLKGADFAAIISAAAETARG